MKKNIIYIYITTLIYGCSSAPQQQAASPHSLGVVSVSSRDVATYQEYPASIRGVDNVEIRPQVNGTLEQVFVDEGDYVQSGQALFKIDDRPFRAALNNAIAGLHAAEGAAANAELEVEKLAPLVKNGVIAEYQLKAAKAASQVAQANIEQAKANISTAQINLGYTLVRAPVSGYIGRLDRKKGSLVGPSDAEALTDLSDVHNVHVYFALAERDFVAFKAQYEGETLREKLEHIDSVTLLLSDEILYVLKGKIDMIDGQFDENTGAIDVRANFPNPKGLLRSGNTGKVRLPLIHKRVLSVPQAAIMELQDKVYVYVLTAGNKVQKTAITVAGKSGENFLISEGLQPGQQVVIEGLGFLSDGMVIAPKSIPENVASIKK